MPQTDIVKINHSDDHCIDCFKGLRALSIRAKVISLILFVSISVLMISGSISLYTEYHSVKSGLKNQLSSFSKLIGNRSTAALAFFDEKTALENLSTLEVIPNIQLACLYDATGNRFAYFSRALNNTSSCFESEEKHTEFMLNDKNLFSAEYQILDGDDKLGRIYLYSSYQPIYDHIYDRLIILLANVTIGIILAIILASWLQKVISNPISLIHDSANEIIEKSDYSIRAPRTTNDEIGRMANSFNRMLETIESKNRDLEQQIEKRQDAEDALREMNTELEDRINLRTVELASKNEELNEALAILKQAQDELVQSEKLASLGSIVAGVAHELNTPIGIGVTAATTIEANIKGFRKKYENNQISKLDLEQFMETTETAMSLIMANLSRGSELVKGFKQVAVDQTSEKRRKFMLDEVISEIVLTVQPQFKHTPHTIITSIHKDIELDSYPGPFGQVMTNLIMNALTHGFHENMEGELQITVKRKGEGYVIVSVKDNGLGIQAEHLKHVFDPFFTTKMGQGGSGLGMHISYNIITGIMGGKMNISSTPGVETEILMTLPLIAPETKTKAETA